MRDLALLWEANALNVGRREHVFLPPVQSRRRIVSKNERIPPRLFLLILFILPCITFCLDFAALGDFLKLIPGIGACTVG